MNPDAIVIGAGPNGLVAANVLADAGWSMLVLEANAEPGGAVRTAEVTAPGFRNDLFSAFYPMTVASPVIADLDLRRFGLEWTHALKVLAHPRTLGPTAVLSRDIDATAASLEQSAVGDGDRYRQMFEQWSNVSTPLKGESSPQLPGHRSRVNQHRSPEYLEANPMRLVASSPPQSPSRAMREPRQPTSTATTRRPRVLPTGSDMVSLKRGTR